MNDVAENLTYLPLGHVLVESSTSQTQVDLPDKFNSTGGDGRGKISFNQLQGLLSKLHEVFIESKELNELGEPVSDAAYYNATRLLSALPADVDIPEILPDNDGYIEFEWREGDKNFSLYATDANLVLFAGFYGKDERLSGRFNFEGVFPDRIKHLAKDVYQKGSQR